MSIKIVAGQFKGRTIPVRPGMDVRPTANVVREALFNILGEWIEGTRVLDLFAGSGGVGFEALSRGAESATFIDRMPDGLRLIGRTAEQLGVTGQVSIVEANAAGKFSSRLEENAQFDFIYIDPPYGMRKPEKILKRIVDDNVLADDGLIVFEQERKETPVPAVEGLVREEIRKYGRTVLLFFTRDDEER